MTVAGLIEYLKSFPQDAPVCTINQWCEYIPLERADISLLHGYDPVVYIDPNRALIKRIKF